MHRKPCYDDDKFQTLLASVICKRNATIEKTIIYTFFALHFFNHLYCIAYYVESDKRKKVIFIFLTLQEIGILFCPLDGAGILT